MIIKLDSAIRNEHWYPSGRAFTEAEARIDLLLSGEKVDVSNTTQIQLLSNQWQWKPNAVIQFMQELINEKFLSRDWVLDETPMKRRAIAMEVIELYNTIFNRRVELTDSRLKAINGRAKEGHGIKQFEAVFKHKKKEWENTDMDKYLVLDTLVRASKFQIYLEAAREDFKKQSIAPKPDAGIKVSGVMFK